MRVCNMGDGESRVYMRSMLQGMHAVTRLMQFPDGRGV